MMCLPCRRRAREIAALEDPEILAYAIQEGRAVLSFNRRHFIRFTSRLPLIKALSSARAMTTWTRWHGEFIDVENSASEICSVPAHLKVIAAAVNSTIHSPRIPTSLNTHLESGRGAGILVAVRVAAHLNEFRVVRVNRG